MKVIIGAWMLMALLAWGLVWAADEPEDWRSEWCSLECWAPDGQEQPCAGCLRRRS